MSKSSVHRRSHGSRSRILARSTTKQEAHRKGTRKAESSRGLKGKSKPEQSRIKARSLRKGGSVGSSLTANNRTGRRAAQLIMRLRSKVKAMYREGRLAEYRAFQEVVIVGRFLASSASAWTEFIGRPCWQSFKKKRPTLKDQPQAEQFAIRLFKGPGQAASKKASLRWRTLQALDRVGVADHEIAEWLEKGGGYEGALSLRKGLEVADQSRRERPEKTTSAMATKTQKIPRSADLVPAAGPGNIGVRCFVVFEPAAAGLQRLPRGARIFIEAEIVNASMPLQLRFFSCSRSPH